MKIVGTTNDKTNLVEMTDDELRFLMFGNPSKYGFNGEQEKLWNNKHTLEIKVCDLYYRTRKIESFKHNLDNDCIKGKLLELLRDLDPIAEFIQTQQRYLKPKETDDKKA